MRIAASTSLTLAALAALAAVAPVHAALVTLGGTNVDFLIDDSQPGLAAYGGLPTVAGDSLLFFPTTFRAESSNGAGAVSANGTVSFEIRAHDAALSLGDIEVFEAGDYFITPDSGGSVSVVSQLGATNLDAANPVASFRQDVESTGTLTAGGANEWNLSTGLNFAQLWSNPTTRTHIDIQNNLMATSVSDNSTSWIEKNFEGMVVNVQVVPLPAGLPLLVSGLAGFGVFLRRRRAAALS
jgi:hypothetical protein